MRIPHLSAVVPFFLALSTLTTGCRDREVAVYQAPKDAVVTPPPAAEPAAPGGLPPGHPPIPGGAAPAAGAAMAGSDIQPQIAAGLALRWKAPAQWQIKPAGSVRKGSYKVVGAGGAEADMAITAFPGDTGGLVANVNRWRSQVGLGEQTQAQIEAALELLDANGLHMDVVDVTGKGQTGPVRLLGAIVPHQGQTWFFKMVGPEPVVAAERAAFTAFLRTIEVP